MNNKVLNKTEFMKLGFKMIKERNSKKLKQQDIVSELNEIYRNRNQIIEKFISEREVKKLLKKERDKVFKEVEKWKDEISKNLLRELKSFEKFERVRKIISLEEGKNGKKVYRKIHGKAFKLLKSSQILKNEFKEEFKLNVLRGFVKCIPKNDQAVKLVNGNEYVLDRCICIYNVVDVPLLKTQCSDFEFVEIECSYFTFRIVITVVIDDIEKKKELFVLLSEYGYNFRDCILDDNNSDGLFFKGDNGQIEMLENMYQKNRGIICSQKREEITLYGFHCADQYYNESKEVIGGWLWIDPTFTLFEKGVSDFQLSYWFVGGEKDIGKYIYMYRKDDMNSLFGGSHFFRNKKIKNIFYGPIGDMKYLLLELNVKNSITPSIITLEERKNFGKMYTKNIPLLNFGERKAKINEVVFQQNKIYNENVGIISDKKLEELMKAFEKKHVGSTKGMNFFQLGDFDDQTTDVRFFQSNKFYYIRTVGKIPKNKIVVNWQCLTPRLIGENYYYNLNLPVIFYNENGNIIEYQLDRGYKVDLGGCYVMKFSCDLTVNNQINSCLGSIAWLHSGQQLGNCIRCIYYIFAKYEKIFHTTNEANFIIENYEKKPNCDSFEAKNFILHNKFKFQMNDTFLQKLLLLLQKNVDQFLYCFTRRRLRSMLPIRQKASIFNSIMILNKLDEIIDKSLKGNISQEILKDRNRKAAFRTHFYNLYKSPEVIVATKLPSALQDEGILEFNNGVVKNGTKEIQNHKDMTFTMFRSIENGLLNNNERRGKKIYYQLEEKVIYDFKTCYSYCHCIYYYLGNFAFDNFEDYISFFKIPSATKNGFCFFLEGLDAVIVSPNEINSPKDILLDPMQEKFCFCGNLKNDNINKCTVINYLDDLNLKKFMEKMKHFYNAKLSSSNVNDVKISPYEFYFEDLMNLDDDISDSTYLPEVAEEENGNGMNEKCVSERLRREETETNINDKVIEFYKLKDINVFRNLERIVAIDKNNRSESDNVYLLRKIKNYFDNENSKDLGVNNVIEKLKKKKKERKISKGIICKHCKNKSYKTRGKSFMKHVFKLHNLQFKKTFTIEERKKFGFK